MALRYDEPESGPPVATDEDASGDNFQVVKVAFSSGSSPSNAERVERGVPLPVRNYHGGSAALDTGRVEIAAASTLITDAEDVWCDLLLLLNLTEQVQPIAVADGSDASYGQVTLQPHEWRPMQLKGLMFAGGLKLSAAGAGLAVAQFVGTH